MIRYLIKNNLKLMFRSKWSVVIMVVGPIIVIMALSSAFSSLLKTYEGVDSFTAGFCLEDDSISGEMVTQMKEAGRANGITFYEYPDGSPEQLMEDNELAGFICLGRETYSVYRTADYEVQGAMLEYFADKLFRGNMNSLQQEVDGENAGVQVEKLDYMPAVDASDYYGIAHIVYFGWCGLVCAAGMLSSEKKYGIERRFRVSSLSSIQIYLARLIPIWLVVTVGMGISTLACSIMFGIHWGVPWLSAVILILCFLGATALALMLYYLSGNVAISVIALFALVWFMGYTGGSFETYMYANIPEKIKLLSPIYHADRALVELSATGRSDYVVSAVIYMLAITVICTAGALLEDKAGRRRRA